MIDWNQVVFSIYRKISLSEAARRIGKGRSYFSGFLNEYRHEPRFEAGVKILDLHRDLYGEEEHKTIIRRLMQ